MKGFATALAASALMLVLAPVSPADGAPCNGSRTVVKTFTVETKWNKRFYRPGDKAKLRVTVARPGPEDPAGNGVPLPSPILLPAEDVTVSTTLVARWPFPWDRAVTDADGKASLSLRIPERWDGKIPARTMASRVYNEGGPACSDAEEQGEQYDLVTVRR